MRLEKESPGPNLATDVVQPIFCYELVGVEEDLAIS
jgi:hypothetical protein